jgi:hypothetical protein
VPDGGGGPVVVTREHGDCEGKGAQRRQPLALVELEGRLFVLLNTYSWDLGGAELWELTDEGLRLAVR